jgi:hypothetical protein
MLQKACIDAHGAVHHIIVRGIERRSIFKDDHGPHACLRVLRKSVPP